MFLPAFVLCAAVLSGAAPSAPEETIEVVSARGGFRPKVLELRKGETTRLLLRSADGEHCFAVDAFRVEKRILPGRTTVLDLTPDRAGTFPFYCCLESGEAADTERGRVVVTE